MNKSLIIIFIFFFVLIFDFYNPIIGNESLFSRLSLSEVTPSRYDYDVLPVNAQMYNKDYNFQPVIMISPTSLTQNPGNTKTIFYNSFENDIRIDKLVLDFCNNTQFTILDPTYLKVRDKKTGEEVKILDTTKDRLIVNSSIISINKEFQVDLIERVAPNKFQIKYFNIDYEKYFDMEPRVELSSYNIYKCVFSIYEENKKISSFQSNEISNSVSRGITLHTGAMVNY